MKEVLVRDKGIVCDFKRVVQGLCHIWEVGTEGKFTDDMRKIHELVIYMLMTSVAVPQCRYVQISGHPLYLQSAPYPTR